MKLTKTKKGGKDLYVAIAGYEEKDIPKSAGFTWNRYFSGKWATFNIECAYKLKEFAGSDLRNELEQLIEKRNKAFELSRQTDTDFKPKAPGGQEFYPFQKVGVQYGIDESKNGVLIADQMGLGKTPQSIGIVNELDAKSILVICPASLKLNWKREIENWDIHSLSVEVIDSKTKKKDIPTTGYVIVNYDIVKKFHEQLTSVEWDVLICDEAHYMKNPKAQRTKLIMGWRPQSGKKSKPIAPIQAKKKLFLTGTPILNKPVELWPLVHNLAPETFNNFMWYAKRYCAAERGYWGWDFSGASNLEELQELLRKTCMVRRLKSEVLTELPDKVRQVLEIPPNGSKEINKLVKEEQEFASKRKEYLDSLRAAAMVAKVAGSKDEYRDIMDKLKGETATLFEEVAKIRVAMAKEKAPYCIEHLESMIESGIDKVIFFGHHKVLLNAIKDHFGDRAVILTGETGDQERQDAVDQFQKNPDVQIFIGSIKAAGVGITLTASSNVVFGELDWTPGWMEQSEDRAHRIGQQASVLIQYLVFQDSLDAEMGRMLADKGRVIDTALDNEIVLKEISALDRIEVEKLEAMKREAEKRPISAKKKEIEEESKGITKTQIQAIHDCLKTLSSYCDGAKEFDGSGFNRVDVYIGHELAGAISLSPKQAALGRRIVKKYCRQLPGDLYKEAMGG